MHRKRLIVTGVVILGLALIALGVIAWRVIPPESGEKVLTTLEEGRAWVVNSLKSIPGPLYFLAFAILPAFGAPLSLFYLTALPILGGTHAAIGIALALLALALNMTLSKLLTMGLFLPAIKWVIRHRNLNIPRIRPDNELKVVLVTRVSPLPFTIQNYLLALGHARWKYYLWLSLLIQGPIGIAVMLVGESILKGGVGYAMMAIFAFLVLTFALQTLRKRLTRDVSPAAS